MPNETQPTQKIQPTIEQLIPSNGKYPSPEEARKIAEQQEKNTKATLDRQPYIGGRAG